MTAMHTPDPKMLLGIWERGVHASNVRRAVLLMSAALPQVDEGGLMDAPVGHRDAWLLTLREALFGSRVECLLACPDCGQKIELDFCVSDIRAPHARPGEVCEVALAGATQRFRVPTSADLLAIESECDAATAERQLLRRLWQPRAGQSSTHAPAGVGCFDELAADVARAISQADTQAEVLLDVSCPRCGARTHEIFDIAAHLWCELDHWARAMLRKVHVLASSYGWSEDCILGMSSVRRQAYLGLIGEAS